jgi:predicted XRE-type DNA-binding protein
MKEKIEIIRGSGNIFADFNDPDAATKQLKARVTAQIISILNAKKLTVRKAATLLGCDPADVQRIRNADIARFTLDRLVRYAIALGCDVQMKFVLPKAA